MSVVEYSFCERTSATGNTWHVRQLTDTGRHLAGGIDTDSLCGRVTAPNGWDLTPPVIPAMVTRMAATIDHTGRQACIRCAEALSGETDTMP